jgi:ubiquinone/menaquinone biosynthesis C-methylase UbiE
MKKNINREEYLDKQGVDFLNWSRTNPIGKIPTGVSREGAGENRIPFAHLANSIPVYLVFKEILSASSKEKASILDAGCGTGRNISYIKETLKKKHYKFFGVDYSDACISYATVQYKKQGVIFAKYNGATLPFPDESIDYVVSSHVIEHIPKKDAGKFISEIARILKPHGVAVVGTPNRKYCQDLFYKNPSDNIKYRLILPHEHEFYINELKELLNKTRLFSKFEIYQTLNLINRELMSTSANKIKPQKNISHIMKFEVYNFLRKSTKLQALMAKLGTEFVLGKMKVSYADLVKATQILKYDMPDKGDNIITVLTK